MSARIYPSAIPRDTDPHTQPSLRPTAACLPLRIQELATHRAPPRPRRRQHQAKLHTSAGRVLFLGAIVHSALWISNHIGWDLPILTQQKEGSGVFALGCLCAIVFSSLAPLRRRCYSAFLPTQCRGSYRTSHTYSSSFLLVRKRPLLPSSYPLYLILFRPVTPRLRSDGPYLRVPILLSSFTPSPAPSIPTHLPSSLFSPSSPQSSRPAPPSPRAHRRPHVRGPTSQRVLKRAGGDVSARQVYYDDQLSFEADAKVVDATHAAEHNGAALARGADMFPERDAHLILERPYGRLALRPTGYETRLLFAGSSGAMFTVGVLDEHAIFGLSLAEIGPRVLRLEAVQTTRRACVLSVSVYGILY
ncbi:hypothetical protein DFH09DRAFT_1106962 [Mycena vulgaris]|nr:hypothetical protein DFH09DRAFT_1106962 [Mycena vulgaris]